MLVVLSAVGAWLYGLSARQAGGALFSRQPSGYYPLLTAGFQAGQLAVKLDPDPRLLALPNPYDPVANAPFRAHDMSLFRGRYYLYFGVTPVLVFFWPIVAATGWFPTEPCAVACFAWVGAMAGLGLLAAVRRRYFPAVSVIWLVLSGTCFVFGSSVVVLTAHSSFYEVPIACAFCLSVLMWGAVYHALHSPRAAAWLALASSLFGLAVGARPTYLLGGLALLIPLRVLMRRPAARPTLVWAAVIPAFLCGIGLACYNWLRFGSIFEFGLHYQLMGWDLRNLHALFDWRRVPANSVAYLFRAGIWQPYFPYFSAVVGMPYGLLRYAPWCWLGALAFLPAAVRARQDQRILAATIAGGLAGNFLLLLLFVGVNDRYAADYVPAWMMLAGLGAFNLAARASLGRRRRLLSLGAMGAAGAISVMIGLGAFASSLPDGVVPLGVARLGDGPTAAVQRILEFPQGALHLDLELGPALPGVTEVLVEAGSQPDRRDWIQLRYEPLNRARVGIYHSGLGLIEGDPFLIPTDRRISVEVRAGFLVAPYAHPIFSRWSPDQYRNYRRDVLITVNQQQALRAALDCYPSPPQYLHLEAADWRSDGATRPYAGRVLSRLRLPMDPPPVSPNTRIVAANRPVELEVFFPADRSMGTEPLLVTGQGQKSDLLACTYLGPGRLRFVFDHFGAATLVGGMVLFNPARSHHLVIWLGALAGPEPGDGPKAEMPWSRRVVVLMDGIAVLNEAGIFYPAGPGPIRIGTNPFGATTALDRFSGLTLSVSAAPGFEGLPPGPIGAGPGARGLRVLFPESAVGRSDPLLVSGSPGAGDILYVRYLDASHVSFGFDHWGHRGLVGPPVKVDYSRPHRLELTMDSLYPPQWPGRPAPGEVRIEMDGQVVLSGTSAAYSFQPGAIWIGRNPIGGSTAGPIFTGQMLPASP